jgi:hypothetical protein
MDSPYYYYYLLYFFIINTYNIDTIIYTHTHACNVITRVVTCNVWLTFF